RVSRRASVLLFTAALLAVLCTLSLHDALPICQLRRVALAEAAGDDELFAAALGFLIGELEDRIDRFLFGGVDEAAGVHHDDFGARRVVDVPIAFVEGDAQHHLTVHSVLGAPQTDEMDGALAAFAHGFRCNGGPSVRLASSRRSAETGSARRAGQRRLPGGTAR